jgi:hypothetical protein
MKVTLILITYSFGTFGFLNLFGLRLAVQAVVIVLVIGILASLKAKYRTKDMISVFLFAGLFGIGGLVHGGYIARPVEALLMIFIIVSIMEMPDRHVMGLTKALVICSAFFSFLVYTAFIGYGLYPSQFQYANFHIYDSTTGYEHISPSSAFDWFSFTSGDGFELAGETRIRLKGYSSEPSSTIVHYLTPVALAFFLGNRYIYIGIFILAVNIIAISSLMALVIISGSLILMSLNYAFRRYLKFVYMVALLMLAVILVQPNSIMNIFTMAGVLSIDTLGFDLIARKVADGDDDASILIRATGISEGIYLLLTSPVGYSYEKLGAGAGLIYIISATTGWPGLTVFILFIGRFLKKALNVIFCVQSYGNQYAIALSTSMFLVMLLISGYGWDRPPGMVVILLMFRLMDIKLSSRKLVESK